MSNNDYLVKIIKNEIANMINIRNEISLNLSKDLYSSIDISSIVTLIEILSKNIEVLERNSSVEHEKIVKIISGLPVLYITIRSIPCLK